MRPVDKADKNVQKEPLLLLLVWPWEGCGAFPAPSQDLLPRGRAPPPGNLPPVGSAW